MLLKCNRFAFYLIFSCHVMLQSLSYCVEIDEHFTLHNYHGKEEAVMKVRIFPLSEKGEYLGEESILEPRELLGKPFNFEISVPECMGVHWCSEDRSRGVYCKYVLRAGFQFCMALHFLILSILITFFLFVSYMY